MDRLTRHSMCLPKSGTTMYSASRASRRGSLHQHNRYMTGCSALYIELATLSLWVSLPHFQSTNIQEGRPAFRD